MTVTGWGVDQIYTDLRLRTANAPEELAVSFPKKKGQQSLFQHIPFSRDICEISGGVIDIWHFGSLWDGKAVTLSIHSMVVGEIVTPNG